jgi:hypothetical protein
MDQLREIKLGPSFTTETWARIRAKLDSHTYDQNWEEAISGIQGRFTERFIKPADAIRQLDQADASGFPEGRGFAIVALDCLLLESLHGYKTGQRTKNSSATKAAFKTILTTYDQFAGAFTSEAVAETFARAVRNGLLHDGETRDGWIIWQGDIGGPIVEPRTDQTKVLYRDAFHAAVIAAVGEYFQKLRSTSSSDGPTLRRTFIQRVDKLCEDSRPKRENIADSTVGQ